MVSNLLSMIMASEVSLSRAPARSKAPCLGKTISYLDQQSEVLFPLAVLPFMDVVATRHAIRFDCLPP